MRSAAVVIMLVLGISSFALAQNAQPPSSDEPKREEIASAKPSDEGKPYTSVIIDASNYRLDRCMSPKIRRSDGSEVWGTVKVDLDFVEEHGIVAYARTLDEARKNPRCGSNPLVIKAIDVGGGKFYSDPVISNPDAKILLDEDAKSGFLKRFNVIFVKNGGL
jgi:hypothetical protein